MTVDACMSTEFLHNREYIRFDDEDYLVTRLLYVN